MSGKEAIRLLIDVSSAGGNLLLNVGPDGDGNLPPLQLKCLEAIGEWMNLYGDAINASRPVSPKLAQPLGDGKSADTWVRWTRIDDRLFAFVEGQGRIKLPVDMAQIDNAHTREFEGQTIEIAKDGSVDLDGLKGSVKPFCIELVMISGDRL